MSVHLLREIDWLKKQILALGAEVEGAVEKAVAAIAQRDARLAGEVIEGDQVIDRHEVEIEEECLKILALHQPVAHDLRFIVAALKMNHEMERIGDMAANLAERASELAVLEPLPPPFAFGEMAQHTLSMVHRSLDALVNVDGQLARQVWTDDREVDAIHRASYGQISDAMAGDPAHVRVYIQYLGVSRFLERIADNATNIAKDVLYMTEGEIVRHRGREFRLPREAGG